MLFTILGWITGLSGPITSIVGKLTDLKIAQVAAKSNTERAEIDAQVDELHDKKAALVAEVGTRIGSFCIALMQLGFALPFVIYNGKLVLWDKVLAWGSTDPLSVELLQIEMICISFYFISTISSNLFRNK